MELASQRRVLFVNEEKSRVGACSNSHERQWYFVEKKKSQIHKCSVPFSIHEVVEQAKLISIRKKKIQAVFSQRPGRTGSAGMRRSKGSIEGGGGKSLSWQGCELRGCTHSWKLIKCGSWKIYALLCIIITCQFNNKDTTFLQERWRWNRVLQGGKISLVG